MVVAQVDLAAVALVVGLACRSKPPLRLASGRSAVPRPMTRSQPPGAAVAGAGVVGVVAQVVPGAVAPAVAVIEAVEVAVAVPSASPTMKPEPLEAAVPAGAVVAFAQAVLAAVALVVPVEAGGVVGVRAVGRARAQADDRSRPGPPAPGLPSPGPPAWWLLRSSSVPLPGPSSSA